VCSHVTPHISPIQSNSIPEDQGFFAKVFPKLSNRTETATLGILDPEAVSLPETEVRVCVCVRVCVQVCVHECVSV
jgi:hypothetical protein